MERDTMIQLVKQTLLKIQNPTLRQGYKTLIVSNSDYGKPVEWEAPLPRVIMRRTIECYEADFNCEQIKTDDQLDKIADFIIDKFQAQARENVDKP